MPTPDELKSLLYECIREYADQTGQTIEVADETPLLGPDSAIDSLGLVMVVTAYEARVNEAANAAVVFANESAMSRRHSPFRSVEALTEYAQELLSEAEAS